MDLHSKGFKKFMAMTYGLGGAVVIVGALFKLMHWPGASLMLIIGLGTEAGIFIISAFEPLPKEETDWSIVYPELAGGKSGNKPEKKDAEAILTSKIDAMLEASNLDAALIGKLTTSVKNFTTAAKNISEQTSSVEGTEKYTKQVATAAGNLEKLNGLYSSQSEAISAQASLNTSVVQKSNDLTKQMDSLTKNISSLNNVYGGMLSAMGKK